MKLKPQHHLLCRWSNKTPCTCGLDALLPRAKIPSLDLLFNSKYPTHGNPFPDGITVVWYRNRGWVPVKEKKGKTQIKGGKVIEDNKVIGERG